MLHILLLVAAFSINGSQVQASTNHRNGLQAQTIPLETIPDDQINLGTVQRQADRSIGVLRDESVIMSKKDPSTSNLFRYVRQTDDLEPGFELRENCSDIHEPSPEYNNSMCELVLEECDGKYELFNYLEFVVCILGEQVEVSH